MCYTLNPHSHFTSTYHALLASTKKGSGTWVYVLSVLRCLLSLDTLSLESSACDILSYLDTRYIRREFDPKAPGLEGLQWDSAHLYMVR